MGNVSQPGGQRDEEQRPPTDREALLDQLAEMRTFLEAGRERAGRVEDIPGYKESEVYRILVDEAAAFWRTRFPNVPEATIAGLSSVRAARLGFDMALGGVQRAGKIMSLLYHVQHETDMLRGVHGWTPPKGAKVPPQVPVDRIDISSIRLFREDKEGNLLSVSEEEQRAERRQIELYSRPNIFCTTCEHPLGIRLPRGPQGEEPPVVYVRGSWARPGVCNQLWWERLDGSPSRSCVHSRVDRVVAILHGLAFPDTAEHIAACPERELHAEIARIERDMAARQHVQVDWTYAFGVVQLVKWKNTALLHNGDALLKLDAKSIALPLVSVPYIQGTGGFVQMRVHVPADGIPLIPGTRGRCPKCGHVQRLE